MKHRYMTFLPIGVGASAAFLLLAAAPAAQAGVLLDFSTQDQYTDNFAESSAGAQVSWNAGGFVRSHLSNTTATIRYDSDLTNSVQDDLFLTETVSSDVTVSGLGGPTFAYFARTQSDGDAVLALVHFDATNSIRLRMWYGADSESTSVGTEFFNQTYALTNTIAANAAMQVVLTQTAGADPVFNLSLLDADGLVASTGDVTLTATDDFNTAGSVGMRIGNSSGTQDVDFDNFSIVPEPASLALLGMGGLMVARRRRCA